MTGSHGSSEGERKPGAASQGKLPTPHEGKSPKRRLLGFSKLSLDSEKGSVIVVEEGNRKQGKIFR